MVMSLCALHSQGGGENDIPSIYTGGGSNARLWGGGGGGGGGGRELRLLCGFNQYTLIQNRDNSSASRAS